MYENVDRVEIINDLMGREYVEYNTRNVKVDLQDNGHTLKIFFDCTSPEISNLRRKRLLLLATKYHNHKRWYSQYRKLQSEGLVSWTLGAAFLTDKGKQWLQMNIGVK